MLLGKYVRYGLLLPVLLLTCSAAFSMKKNETPEHSEGYNLYIKTLGSFSSVDSKNARACNQIADALELALSQMTKEEKEKEGKDIARYIKTYRTNVSTLRYVFSTQPLFDTCSYINNNRKKVAALGVAGVVGGYFAYRYGVAGKVGSFAGDAKSFVKEKAQSFFSWATRGYFDGARQTTLVVPTEAPKADLTKGLEKVEVKTELPKVEVKQPEVKAEIKPEIKAEVKAELPKVEEIKVEQPKVELPKVEQPKVEVKTAILANVANQNVVNPNQVMTK